MGASGRVFVLLWAIYLLSYGGGPHAVDEIGQLGATASLVKRGSFAANELFWTIAAAGDRADAQVEVGPSGDVWSKRGPSVPLAMAPWYALAMAVPSLDLVFTALLAMGLITAATGAMLTLLARRLGSSEGEALAAGLLYGLTGLAWAYARLGFGEPLIAFAAVLGALAGRRGMVGAAVAGGCVAMAAGTKWSAGLLGLPLAAYLVWPGPCGAASRLGRLGRLVAFGTAGAAGLALLGWYNAVHFGSPLATGYGVDPREGFTASPLEGLYGLTVSPYRGILWFAPTVVVGAALLPLAAKRAGLVAWLAGGVALLTLGTYAAWWTWWGGFTWGPRFLLPAAPLLCLMVPLAWPRLGRAVRWLVGGAIGLSGLLQLPGVLLDFNPYEKALRERGFSLEASPILGHLRRLGAEGTCALDLTWLGCERFDLWLSGALAGAVLAGLMALRMRRWSADGVAVAVLAVGLVALLSRGPTPPSPAEQDLLAAAAWRAAAAQPDDATIVLASPEVPALWEHDRWRGEVYGFNHDDLARVPETIQLLGRAIGVGATGPGDLHRRVWVIATNVPRESAVEQWIADGTFVVNEREFGKAWVVQRMVGVEHLEPNRTAVASFDGGLVVLQGAIVRTDPPRVQLLWRGSALPGELKVFIHLYRSGQLVGQIDAPLRERMNYVLPAVGGEASVEVGVYRPDGRRLATSFPENRVPIGTVR